MAVPATFDHIVLTIIVSKPDGDALSGCANVASEVTRIIELL